MERIWVEIKQLGMAYKGAFGTFLFQVVGQITPADTFINYFSSYISIVVGLLTALYTLTKIWDWAEAKFFHKKPSK